MSYSGDPSTTTRDAVRFLIHDTDTANEMVRDAEIEWVLSKEPEPHLAAARLCSVIIARGANSSTVTSKSIGGFSVSYGGDIKSAYNDLARDLRMWAEVNAGPEIFVSVSENEDFRSDTDWDQGAGFRIGQFDFESDINNASLTGE